MPSAPLVTPVKILLEILVYLIFSLSINIVPFEGKLLALAADIVESRTVMAVEVVVEAVSKSEALVNVKELSESLIPPESFNVV